MSFQEDQPETPVYSDIPPPAQLALPDPLPVQVPSSELQNPFLQSSSVHQGTFYVIFLPIVGGFVLAFLLGSAYNRFRAKSQARHANLADDSFDSDYTDSKDDPIVPINIIRHKTVAGQTRGIEVAGFRPVRSIKLPSNSHTKVFYQPHQGPAQVTTLHLKKQSDLGTPELPIRASLKRPVIRKNTSIVLDQFIQTGELPMMDAQTAPNSIYESGSNSYVSSRSISPAKSNYSYSQSPKRHAGSSVT
ncbi:hypothetical protein OGAPHI_004196 [Ogataea philodendri]|uniref:Transmembrane protein n=1 Tax=Ogataea philodendri TaxID=1378263 RepID=A0A9P8P662_9ASCO|nr:uncharacterized protein OGAPHI_004196 [Ogataea philodendri]KAH3666007.1 hypothetical protein OGAPHI_004196 [Ogataea philodendri]